MMPPYGNEGKADCGILTLSPLFASLILERAMASGRVTPCKRSAQAQASKCRDRTQRIVAVGQNSITSRPSSQPVTSKQVCMHPSPSTSTSNC